MRYDNLAVQSNEEMIEEPEAGASQDVVPEATGPRLVDVTTQAESGMDECAVEASPVETAMPDQDRVPVNAAEALVLGTVVGPGKLVAPDGEPLVIDPENNAYYSAEAALKPLAELLHLSASAWVPVYSEALKTIRGSQEPRPLARLRWYAGLIATPGVLNPDLDRAARYQLARWTETEREFPKHLRIARHMLTRAATVDTIAEASGLPYADVADYINASHAGGRLKTAAGTSPVAALAPSRRERLIARLNKPLFAR